MLLTGLPKHVVELPAIIEDTPTFSAPQRQSKPPGPHKCELSQACICFVMVRSTIGACPIHGTHKPKMWKCMHCGKFLSKEERLIEFNRDMISYLEVTVERASHTYKPYINSNGVRVLLADYCVPDCLKCKLEHWLEIAKSGV